MEANLPKNQTSFQKRLSATNAPIDFQLDGIDPIDALNEEILEDNTQGTGPAPDFQGDDVGDLDDGLEMSDLANEYAVGDENTEDVAELDETSEDLENFVRCFLLLNPSPTEEQVHALASAIGLDKESLEAVIYAMLGDTINMDDEGLESTEESGTENQAAGPNSQVLMDDGETDYADPDKFALVMDGEPDDGSSLTDGDSGLGLGGPDDTGLGASTDEDDGLDMASIEDLSDENLLIQI